jgi:predicted ABC-type ATPase
VNLVIVNNNVNTVLSRIEKRAKESGRNVDIDYTKSVYTELDKAIPKYLGLTCESVNGNIYLYDNSSQLKLVYSTYCKDNEKKLKCVLDVCNIQKGGKNKRKGKKSKKAGKKSKKAGKKSRKSRRKTYRRRRR